MISCAVIVTYNRLEKLKITIDAYVEAGINHLVIVNNASSDETASYLNALCLGSVGIDVLNLPENTGGAGGFHAGLKFARQLKRVDWVVVSDDDSYPDTQAISVFKASASSLDSYSLFASAVYYPDYKICAMNKPLLLPSLSGAIGNVFSGNKISGINESSYKQEAIVDVTASSFVGMFIRHQALREADVLPDASYFLYWDDIGFCLDMTKQGHRIAFMPSVQFIHDCPRHSHSLSKQRLYYMVRNGLRIINKLPLSIRVFSMVIKIPNWFFIALKNRSLSYFIKAIREV